MSTPRPMPSSVPVLKRTLVWGGLSALILAVVGGVVAGLVAGPVGAWSAVLGAVFSAVFLGITAASILLAVRFDIVAFFGIVLGAWVLKFVVFIVVALLLKNQPWINPLALFLTMIIGVVVSLVVDLVVVMKSRMPYVSDLAPRGDNSAGR